VTAKLRGPQETVLIDGTMRSRCVAEHRKRLPGFSVTDRHNVGQVARCLVY